MAKALQRRRGTHEEHKSFTGLEGEFTYDTTEKRIVAHDGATAGGIPMAKKSEVDAIDVGVTSFNGSKGAVTYSAPVSSVNGKTGAVTVDVGVTSVNGQTGAVTISVPATPNAYVTATWSNGTSWYRKWSDGWIEQGGVVPVPGNDSYTCNFHTPFSNTNYTVQVTRKATSNKNSYGIGVNNVSTSYCVVWCASGEYSNAYWRAEGY